MGILVGAHGDGCVLDEVEDEDELEIIVNIPASEEQSCDLTSMKAGASATQQMYQ